MCHILISKKNLFANHFYNIIHFLEGPKHELCKDGEPEITTLIRRQIQMET